MKWATALSTEPTLALALQEATASIEQALAEKEAHLVFAFVSCLYGDDIALLPQTIAARLNHPVLVGCSGGGIIGSKHEVEQGPALTLLAAHLPDALAFQASGRKCPASHLFFLARRYESSSDEQRGR